MSIIVFRYFYFCKVGDGIEGHVFEWKYLVIAQFWVQMYKQWSPGDSNVTVCLPIPQKLQVWVVKDMQHVSSAI